MVVPALNEAGTIAKVVAGIGRHGQAVVVDDGSTDGTAGAAEAAGAIVLGHPQPRGYDAALHTGMAWASRQGYGVIATMDADAQHDPRLLADFFAPIQSGSASVVLGSRTEFPRAAERLFAHYVRRRYGVSDILCGMKAFSQEWVEGREHLMIRRSVGTRLALAALRDGAPVSVVNVPVAARQGESTRFGSGWRPNARIAIALVGAILDDVWSVTSRSFSRVKAPSSTG